MMWDHICFGDIGLVRRLEFCESRKVRAMNKHEALGEFTLLLAEVSLGIIATIGLIGGCIWMVK
jgi:hypothetical protein